MKTKFTLMIATVIAITIFGPQKSNGQQAWQLTANNNANANSRLGTLSNFPLVFVANRNANGKDWMRLETDGRVNINADGLASSLTQARFAINSSPQQDPFRVMINGNTRFLVNEKGGVSIGTTTEGPAQGLYVNGNAGIGIAEPAVKLHVNGGTNAGLNGGGYMVIGSPTSQNIALDVNGIMSRSNGTASPLYLNEYGGNVYIDRNNTGSRLGIGTSAPEANLHIFRGSAGTVTANANSPLVIENSTNNYISLLTPAANEKGIIFGDNINPVNGAILYNASENMLFQTGKKVTRMVLTAAGSVGIGTSTPVAKLHVANGTDVAPTGGGFVVIGDNAAGLNIAIDNNEIMARNGATADGKGTLNFNNEGGNVIIDGTNSGSNVGIGTATPDFQLQLSKNSAAKPGSSFWTVASATGLEKNIADFTDGLNVIKQIHPVSYNYDGEKGIAPNERFVGTLVQELQKVAPYMVKEGVYQNEENGVKTNYLGVDYNALLFMFVNAFKEQQEEIKSLDAKVEELTKLVMNNQTSTRTSSTQTNAITTKVITAHASLEQNAPNPFNSSTVIRYHIPASVSNAQIMITNASGNMIKTFTLNNKGAGSVTIKAGELAAGSYYYTLITDGKKADSKQMILNK